MCTRRTIRVVSSSWNCIPCCTPKDTRCHTKLSRFARFFGTLDTPLRALRSQSAKDLITDLFKRQADDPKLTRGEALRQAMVALMDGKGFVDASGNTEFTYAHPLFWAPYTIIGDGGRR